MAQEGNYTTWLMYLVMLNIVSAVVFAAFFSVINFDFDGTGNIQKPIDSGNPYAITNQSGRSLATFTSFDFSFGSTLITSLVLVPFTLWDLAPPVGMTIVLFFALLKIGIVICLYKIINPVSSG